LTPRTPRRGDGPLDEADRERRVADAWEAVDRLPEDEFRASIERLAAELPADSGVGWFERASALDRAEESVALLRAEVEAASDHLDDAVRAFLALALVDTGREREAAAIALAVLAPHLPRYQRSLASYARLLVDAEPGAT
jgi:tetratricopeptide repeat protein